MNKYTLKKLTKKARYSGDATKLITRLLESNFDIDLLKVQDTLNDIKAAQLEQKLKTLFCDELGRYMDDKEQKNLLDAVKLLAELHGSEFPVNFMLANGQTLLTQAIRKYNLDLVKLLVDLGADINVANSSGETPLQVAKTYDIKKRQDNRNCCIVDSDELDDLDIIAQYLENVEISNYDSDDSDEIAQCLENVKTSDS